MPEIFNILFVVNPGSGSKQNQDWEAIISEFFADKPHHIHFFKLTGGQDEDAIKKKIKACAADRVIAVGGDGTVALVGKILIGTDMPLGIVPAGSANGMATELKIPANTGKALDIVVNGTVNPCDTICINDKEMVFHLADIGLNALLIKYFDESRFRGMWTYARMLIKAILNQRLMKVHIKADNLDRITNAYMVVIANASKYGTGAVINPDAVTDDGIFELIVIRKITFSEFVKLFWSYKSFDPRYVEIFETTWAEISSRRRVRFQIDGEYQGKIKSLSARIYPSAFNVILPAADASGSEK